MLLRLALSWQPLGRVGGQLLEQEPPRPEQPRFKTTIGAIVTKRQQMPYEDTMLVAFTYGLPKTILGNELDGSQDCPPQNIACGWEIQIQKLSDWLRYSLKNSSNPTEILTPAISDSGMLQLTKNGTLVRRKRAWWSLAASAVPLVAEYFPKLINLFRSSDPTPKVETNAVMEYKSAIPTSGGDLPEKIARIHNNYIEFKKRWESSKIKSDNSVNYRKLEAEIDGLQIVTNGLLELSTLDAAMEKCNENFLPPRLVRISHLKDALQKVTSHLLKFNAEPVIPKDNVGMFYNVKSATCTIKDNKFVINFRIPVRKAGDKLQLINLHPAPFKIKDVTCYILDEPVTVAMMGTRAFFLPINYCKEEEFFCQVPRDHNPSEVAPCLTGFFPDEEINTVQCEPKCQRSIEPIVTEAAQSEFWIVTDDQYPISVECPGMKETAIPDIAIGTRVISLPCACSINYGPKILVSAKLICDENSRNEILTEQLVPIQWTRRPASSFLDLMQKPPTVYQREVIVKEENEVEVQGEAVEIPEWAVEILVTVGGSILVTVTTCCLRSWRRRVANRQNATVTDTAGDQSAPLTAVHSEHSLTEMSPSATTQRHAVEPCRTERIIYNRPRTLEEICAEARM